MDRMHLSHLSTSSDGREGGAAPPSGRLLYRKASTTPDSGAGRGGGGGGGRSPVDWEHFDEEMSRVDSRFSNPKFDSLKHVLTVLSSNRAEQELEELRDQRDAVEGLVDAVVEGYHAGFNKSIHNYSQILRLFTEARMQLETLRRSLEAAKRKLASQSRHMVAQYQRDLMLSDTLRLLGDIQGCVDVPARVQRLEESKEWPLAVSVLLNGCNKLARQELAAVGALKELAAEMGRRRAALLGSLVAELEARVYRLEATAGTAGAAGAAGGGMGAGGDAGSLAAGEGGLAGRPSVPRLPLGPPGGLQQRPANGEAEWSAAAGNLSARGLPPRPPLPPGAAGGLPPPVARTGSWSRDLAGIGGGSPGDGLGGLPSLPRRATHRRAQTLGGLMQSAATGLTALDGHLVDAEAPLSALVDCVAQLGALQEAQAALRRHMPAQLRSVISQAVDSFPASQRLAPQDSRHSPKQQRQGAGGGPAAAGQEDISVSPDVAATAQALLEHVLGCCLQVFRQATDLLHSFSSARVPKPSSGLELLLRQVQEQQAAALPHPAHPQALLPSGAPPPPLPLPGPPGPEATKAEVNAAWECVQRECQRLLADVLGVAPPAQQAQRGGEDLGDVPLAGWLAAVGQSGGEPGGDAAAAGAASAAGGAGTLAFSLTHEVEGLVTKPGGAAGAAGELASRGMGPEAAADLRQRIRAVFGGAPGSPALVASLYRPVLQFAESAERHVSALTAPAGGADGAGGRLGMAALLAMPWQRGGGESPSAERGLLRSYVESFLRMEFLPAVYVSARARCSATLEDPEAFKPRTRLRAPYQAGAGAEGRPLLPAALATERMVEELLGWAALVPPFATHLTGVVENVLGRVVDAFEAQVALVLGRSAAGRLAESLPVVQLMAKEPAAALLGSPVAFFVGRNTEAMESFVSSVIAAGFGANDESVERDILQQLMRERPVPSAALMSAGGDVARLASLAALSDSLDYVADVIQRCTAPGGTAGGGGTAAGGVGASATCASEAGVLLARRGERQSSEGSGGGSGAATPLGGEPLQQQFGAAPPPASQQQQQGQGSSSSAAAGPTWQQQLGSRFRAWRRAGGEGGSLTEGLAHLADRYRALAGLCVRAMRLDLLLLTLHHLQQLPRSSYVCASEEEAREVDECVAALARLVGRLEEGLDPYLPPHKRAYAFCSLAPAAARMAIWLLPDIAALNALGVQRMCRMLASLQPALAGVAAGGSRPDAARAFDRAKLYYTLLTYSAEGLVATAADKPHRFTPAEYTALLAASVSERQVSAEHRASLAKVLAEAGAGRGPKPVSKATAALALQGAFAKAVKAIKQ